MVTVGLHRGFSPHPPQEPGLFEADVVSSQLRYSGILETIRIRKEGFPIRIPFLVFIDRCPRAAGWAQLAWREETGELVGVLGTAFGPGYPRGGSWDPPVWVHSTRRSCLPTRSAHHHGEALCRCAGEGPGGDGAGGSPRYRCLVDMWSNVIPNGANCVEMLRNLCPVNPSMYYVGVSKVPSWGRRLGSGDGRPRRGAHSVTPLPSSS